MLTKLLNPKKQPRKKAYMRFSYSSFFVFLTILVSQTVSIHCNELLTKDSILNVTSSHMGHHHNSTNVHGHSKKDKFHDGIDCPAFLAPIKSKRNACLANATEEVDMCVYFASDYNYILPFLIHYLSLGFSNIWIYNNDDHAAWYKHPAIMCLMRDNYINIQPWFGENALLEGIVLVLKIDFFHHI
jgi:hypothetical protein